MMQAILKYKNTIIKLFQLTEVSIVVVWCVVAAAFAQNRDLLAVVYETGIELGEFAILFYCSTLVPGILQRLNLFTTLRVIMMLFRRHLGIMTFLLIWLHMSWGSTLPLISFYGVSLKALSVLSVSQWLGLSAFTLLVPLFITSNDYSVKKLGKAWKSVHKLTYVVLFLVFLHVALIESKWLLVIVPTMIAWIFSWINYFSTQFAKKQAVVSSDTINQ